MASPSPSDTPGGRLPGDVSLGHWLAFGTLWFLAMGLVVVFTYPQALTGGQLDADGYMRLVRVELLVDGWDWFDNRIPRSNWPFGDTLHWTRPLDVLIILLALPLLPFLGVSAGLQASGTLISPFLHLASCLALIWVVAPIVSLRVRALAAPALLVQPVVLSYGLAGRADHHALIGFLFVLALGFALRWILDPTRERAAWATGLVCALGIWVSPEFLLPLALFLLAGTVVWIRDGRAAAGANLALAGGLALGLTAALFLERSPREWLTAEYDRISVAHWTMGLLAAGFWLVVAAAATGRRRVPGQWPVRLGFAVAGGVVAAGLLHLVHPDFFRGPWISTYSRVQEVWLQHVAELQPVWPHTAADVGRAVAALGLAPLAIGLFAWRGWRAGRSGRRATPGGNGGRAAPGGSGLRSEGPLWIFLAVAALVFTAMTLAQARWGLYAGALYAIGVVGFLDPALARADAALEGMRRRVVRLGLILALVPGVLFTGYVLSDLLAEEEEEDTAFLAEGDAVEACHFARLAPALGDPAVAGTRVTTVLAHVDRGPEILYRTPHRVLAGPYHRNREGILDIYEAFTRAPDDPVVLGILAEREIGLVVLCPEVDRGFLARGEEGSTFHRLADGPLPPWARPVALPEEGSAGFLVFRVEGAAGAGAEAVAEGPGRTGSAEEARRDTAAEEEHDR